MKKATLPALVIALIIIGLIFYFQRNSQPTLAPSPSPSAVSDSRASDPNDPVYKELIESLVVKDELNEAGPGEKMAILEKHQNDVVLMNIYNPEDGGHALWAHKTNGNWVKIYAGQEVPKCDLLENAGIEAGIKCLNPNWETECVGPKANDNSCITRVTK